MGAIQIESTPPALTLSRRCNDREEDLERFVHPGERSKKTLLIRRTVYIVAKA